MNTHLKQIILGTMTILFTTSVVAQTIQNGSTYTTSPSSQVREWLPVTINKLCLSQRATERIIHDLSNDLNISLQQTDELLKSIEIYQCHGSPDASILPIMSVSFRWEGNLPVSQKLLAVACILREREINTFYFPATEKVKKFSKIYDKILLTINDINKNHQLLIELHQTLLESEKNTKNELSPQTFNIDRQWMQMLCLLRDRTRQKCDNTLQQISEISNKDSPYISLLSTHNQKNRFDVVFLPVIR